MSPHVPLCRRTLKKSSQADIAALGDAAGVIHLARLIPARDKAEIRTNLTGSAKAGGIGQSGRDRPKRAGSAKAGGIVDGRGKSQGGQRSDTGNGHKAAADLRSPRHLLHVGIDGGNRGSI